MTKAERIAAAVDPSLIPSDDRRTQERRRHDKWRVRGQRFWAALISLLLIWMAISIEQNNAHDDRRRIEGTKNRCDGIQHTIDAAVGLGAPINAPGLAQLKKDRDDCRRLQRRIEREVK